MTFWPLLFATFAFADELAVERYCFVSQAAAARAAAQLEAIAVPSDKAVKEEQCLTVSMLPHRRELIQRFLRSIDPQASIQFSSTELRREPCHLMVEKIKSSEGSSNAAGIGSGPFAQSSSTKAAGSETFQIQTLKDFELSADQDVILGECRYISPSRYEISIKVRKDPKPIIPPVAPGTIVVVQTPPPDQETMLVQTQLQLERGNKIEIGQVVRDLKDKSHDLNASPSIRAGADWKKITEKIFLSIH